MGHNPSYLTYSPTCITAHEPQSIVAFNFNEASMSPLEEAFNVTSKEPFKEPFQKTLLETA